MSISSSSSSHNVDYEDFTNKMLTAYNQYLTDLSAYFESLQQKAYGDMTDIVRRLSEFEIEQEALWNAFSIVIIEFFHIFIIKSI